MTLSNPTKAKIPYPRQKILEALSQPDCLEYNPSPFGLGSARQAVSDYYHRRGSSIPRSDIVLTASTSEAYAFLFKLLTNPGDQVLVPQPGYPLFDFISALESVRAVPYNLVYADGWQIDLPAFESRLKEGARAVLLVHPNNPTGSYLKRREWEKLADLCSSSATPLICDEVFFEYSIGDAPLDPSRFGQTLIFLLNGLSKLAGLPQMKLAWIAVKGRTDLKDQALEKLEFIADTYLSVSAPVQHAASTWLNLAPEISTRIKQRTSSNLEFLRSALNDSPVDVLRVEGGWYSVIRLPATCGDEEWALRLLCRRGVLTHPGGFFGFSPRIPCIVISLLPCEPEFQSGILGLKEEICR